MPAAELARFAGVSRQTIYAIEEGHFTPNTAVALRIGRALEATVEELFPLDQEDELPAVNAIALNDEMALGRPVRLCRVGEQLMAVPATFVPAYLPPADAIIDSHGRKAIGVSGIVPPDDGKRLLLAGCDPALSLLGEQLRGSEIDVIGVPCSSRKALDWLRRGRVHAAGTHLLDHASGEYNLPIIRRTLPQVPVRVVTFATWEQGLVVARGNPKGIRSIADLGFSGVQIVNREKGSGSRDLLDASMRESGLNPEQVRGYDSVAEGHLAAAYAVASGVVDSCVAPRSAARCFGLDFVPLAVERFDLCFTANALNLPATRAVLDVLQQAQLRKKLRGIAGYDTAHTGDVLM